MMFGRRKFVLLLLVSGSFLASMGDVASAAYRQRYSGWSYHTQKRYHYRHYYYKPHRNYSGYQYHYCIYYTSRPRYVYYYNPVRRVYWGRYDLEKQGYSMLANEDRKSNLDEIPEEAFPAPGEMPPIPDSEDGEQIVKIEKDDLPVGGGQEGTPKDLPSE